MSARLKRKKNGNGLCNSDQARNVRRLIQAWTLFSMALSACSTAPVLFTPADPIPSSQVTHEAFSNVLLRSVKDGWVNYAEVSRDEEFERYVAQFNRIDPNGLSSRDARMAFWINAYNAFAMKGILDGLSPVPYVGWYRYFKMRQYHVGGQMLTLYELEHRILRKEFQESLVHFALVCASRSCPKLRSEAYRDEALGSQLDEAARMFINDSSRNRFDRAGRIAYLSKIFDWFEEDFAASAGTALAFVSRYIDDPELAHDLRTVPYRVEYLQYDWELNGTPPGKDPRAGSS